MHYLFSDGLENRECTIRMSDRAMAKFMTAVINSQARVLNSYGFNIPDIKTKHQYHSVAFKIQIHPTRIDNLEEESGVELTKEIVIKGCYF